MKLRDFWQGQLLTRREVVLPLAAGLAAIIALMDWLVVRNYSIGILYILPIVLAAGFLNRWQIALVAVGCGILREIFSPFSGDSDWLPRIGTISFGFVGAGLFVSELARNRRSALAHIREVTSEVAMRIQAQTRLQAIIESSLAPILTVNSEGRVLLANQAAHQVFAFAEGALIGECIYPYLPEVAALSRLHRGPRGIRTFLESTAYRRSGEAFLANMWISSHAIDTGSELAILLFDVSEQLREREDADFRRLHLQSRILLGGFWHEVRNLCGAINIVQENLKRVPVPGLEADMQALTTLVSALDRFASTELDPGGVQPRTSVDLRSVLSHLQVIADPLFREIQAQTRWDIAPNLPLVEGDHDALLQVFLNLVRNARTALMDAEPKEFHLTVKLQDGRVVLRFWNSGRPVSNAKDLFRPFQSGTGQTGLGLYISRAIARRFGGDVTYEAVATGACFVVEFNLFHQWET